MNFVRKVGILPLAIFVIALFFISFVRVHRTRTPADVAGGKPAGSLLGYHAGTLADATPDSGTCLTQMQFAQVLGAARQRDGLQLAGTATAQDGRRIEIYQTIKTAGFMIYTTGADRTGQYRACPLASGTNLQFQSPAAAPPAIAITLPQTAPATAPR